MYSSTLTPNSCLQFSNINHSIYIFYIYVYVCVQSIGVLHTWQYHSAQSLSLCSWLLFVSFPLVWFPAITLISSTQVFLLFSHSFVFLTYLLIFLGPLPLSGFFPFISNVLLFTIWTNSYPLHSTALLSSWHYTAAIILMKVRVRLWLHRWDDIMSHNLSLISQRPRAGCHQTHQ